MKYHPITDTIDLQASLRDILDTQEFKSVYPTLSEYLDSFEQQGIPEKNDLKQLLNFLVTGLSNAKGTQSRFRNEAERFTLFCWHERGKSVLDIKLEDIKLYIDWIWSPPKNLMAMFC